MWTVFKGIMMRHIEDILIHVIDKQIAQLTIDIDKHVTQLTELQTDIEICDDMKKRINETIRDYN